MRHRHLDFAGPQDQYLHPAALVSLLERGSLDDWLPLVALVREDPGGEVADVLLDVCVSYPFEVPAPAYLFQELVLQVRREAGLEVPDFRLPPEPVYT